MKQFSSTKEALANIHKLGQFEQITVAGRPARVMGKSFRYTDGNVGCFIPRDVDGDVYQRTANGRARSAQ
jgi:hypothetical protein